MIEEMSEMTKVEETPEVEEVAEETVSIPASLLGGKTVAAGDKVSLEVVDVDEENGMVHVRYAQAPKEQPKKLGVEAMAAEFD